MLALPQSFSVGYGHPDSVGLCIPARVMDRRDDQQANARDHFADIGGRQPDVRFARDSGHQLVGAAGPLPGLC